MSGTENTPNAFCLTQFYQQKEESVFKSRRPKQGLFFPTTKSNGCLYVHLALFNMSRVFPRGFLSILASKARLSQRRTTHVCPICLQSKYLGKLTHSRPLSCVFAKRCIAQEPAIEGTTSWSNFFFTQQPQETAKMRPNTIVALKVLHVSRNHSKRLFNVCFLKMIIVALHSLVLYLL